MMSANNSVWPVAVVTRPKFGGLFQHYGILLSNERIVHCAPGRGEHVSSSSAFAAGEDITIGRELSPIEQMATRDRIVEVLRSPQAYDFLTNNCEIFVNRLLGRKSSSDQLCAVVLLIGRTAFSRVAAA